MRQFKTGILSLDAQLRGGFPEGSVILILEDPGAGGDVLSYHFAVEGAKSGDKVLYVSTDDPADYIRESMRCLDGDTIEKIEILDFVSPKLQSATPRDFLRRMRYDPLNGLRTLLNTESFDRVVVNNLTFFLLHYDKEEVFKLIEDFSMYSKRDNSVYLIMLTKGMFDSRTETAMKHVADGVIELTLKEVENEMQRRLKFLKLKRILVPKAILRYDITEKGIKMESVMRVL
ncbi:RAD55 family ATPase [Archaeoglobus veneficus]|uniref:KaiC-like domain-containing protein n=1 Tax=Archaeoglobus veneficus (strain DSM 11195 / SNP6) TaxID=693661 RepID=F2KS53_ARCVS|nr:RAD55 family ATPase [Archaeoglobus veneficus]AEA47992.1 hypothetical protein Arcve_1999 [Archaeoglobus veneficus SNP6]